MKTELKRREYGLYTFSGVSLKGSERLFKVVELSNEYAVLLKASFGFI